MLFSKKEDFKLPAKTGYGRTVSNIQGKGITNDGSSYRKTARPETCVDMGTNNTLEPEERKVTRFSCFTAHICRRCSKN